MTVNNLALTKQEKKIVTLAALGGMLEFYDFIIYGIFSVYFAHQFFPSGNEMVSIIESYVVFILGYIARPIGGIIFSHVGDEHGRKKVLIITIILMGLSSLGIGLLPTYEQIGIFAPIGLLIFRLLQGFALGGELPSTYVYINESMPHKRGTGFGITMTGVNSGLLLGMIINHGLSLILTTEQITEYGWRIPFIIGGALCVLSYKIRQSLQETTAFERIENKPDFPIVYLFKNHLPQMIAGIAATAIMSGLVVVAIVFMPTYLSKMLGVDTKIISYIMPIALLLNVTTIYITGRFANHASPYIILRNLLLSSIILAPLSYFAISYGYILIGVSILSILEGIAAMIIPMLITYLFPAQIRLTGVALSYNISFTIFGGLAPIVISSAINSGVGIYTAPISFIAIIITCSIFGLIYAKRHSEESIS
ncbi:MAG: MFS transporter [Burkholderiales bacterium]|nr:MFS transporter [Burkholderiales bacterium]